MHVVVNEPYEKDNYMKSGLLLCIPHEYPPCIRNINHYDVIAVWLSAVSQLDKISLADTRIF